MTISLYTTPVGVQYDYLVEGDRLMMTNPMAYDLSTMELKYLDSASPARVRKAALLAKLINNRWQISLASVKGAQLPFLDPLYGFALPQYAKMTKTDTVLVYGYQATSAEEVMSMYLTVENGKLCLKDVHRVTVWTSSNPGRQPTLWIQGEGTIVFAPQLPPGDAGTAVGAINLYPFVF